jgi:8-oxo-dGTP diphosphatase
MAVAFLFNDNHEVLFLQKKPQAAFLSGYLVPVGGHLEEDELNDPQRACLREIEEETGLTIHDINDLSLRYIVHRVKEGQEIRIQYIYMGKAATGSRVRGSEEGQLEWVDCSTLKQRNATASTQEVLRHYMDTGIHNSMIYTGTMYSIQGEPAVQWAILQDWEG